MKVNTLMGKILLATLASSLLALLLVSGIQRGAFKRGLSDFLERQEEVQISHLLPELQAQYRRNGSWEELREEPRRWLRLLARTRPEGVGPGTDDSVEPGPLPGGRRPAHGQPGKPRPAEELRQLWRRMFLLDADLAWVAGMKVIDLENTRMQAVQVAGVDVGWVGFVPAPQAMSKEARRFLTFQRNTLVISAVIALLLAAGVGFLLARHLSRPVVALRDSVQRLTAGDFSTRTKPTGGDEIAALGAHINRLAETLQANQTARQRWTADIAHELRTPLAILQAEIEAARDGVRANLEKSLDSVHEEILHLSRLVDDLQSLALADAGALNLKLEETDLAALLRQVLESLHDRASQAGLGLELIAPGEAWFKADSQRIRQLLLNLLENACRYTDAGGQVRVRLSKSPSGIELLVEDSAPGLDEGQREKLFERFYRAEGSRSRAGGGAGLGLSICREIVHSHGGEIVARASELGGVAIIVRLPHVA